MLYQELAVAWKNGDPLFDCDPEFEDYFKQHSTSRSNKRPKRLQEVMRGLPEQGAVNLSDPNVVMCLAQVQMRETLFRRGFFDPAFTELVDAVRLIADKGCAAHAHAYHRHRCNLSGMRAGPTKGSDWNLL